MKLLCFDIESNGLHGEGFAVGAVLIQSDGAILDQFEGRCPMRGEIDPWVKENVLPALSTMPENYYDGKGLRDAFWRWYVNAKKQADFVLADNGYPVESRFLIACQDDDPGTRYTEHPFPLLDLSSLMLAAGVTPLTDRADFISDRLKGVSGERHHPTFDALTSALAAFKALETSGQLIKNRGLL